MAKQDVEKARKLATDHIDSKSSELRTKVNQVLHSNPETCWEEKIAHDTITGYLESAGYSVTPHAHGIETSFEATAGSGGRQIVICAEYDALPNIGHGCGHNLIATASITAFIGIAQALAQLKIAGRVRLLGTPAEEAGGGKALLLERGAFEPHQDIAAAIMAHGLPLHIASSAGVSGIAGVQMLARDSMSVEFRGRPAHAAAEPWSGVNALDAAVAAYNGAAMLRQQIKPDERIHAIIKDGGSAVNVVPDYVCMLWCVRAPTASACKRLHERILKCIEAGAMAAGCTYEIKADRPYMNLKFNETLCSAYVDEMKRQGETIMLRQDMPYTASTDMGNVSHLVPTFHGGFGVETEPTAAMHSREFATAAEKKEAHESAIRCGKGMAGLALRVLMEDEVAEGAKRDFKDSGDSS